MSDARLRRIERAIDVLQKAASSLSAARRANFHGAIATLRQWAIDARAVTVTQQNAVAVLQTIVNRLATFFDNFADLLETIIGRR